MGLLWVILGREVMRNTGIPKGCVFLTRRRWRLTRPWSKPRYVGLRHSRDEEADLIGSVRLMITRPEIRMTM